MYDIFLVSNNTIDEQRWNLFKNRFPNAQKVEHIKTFDDVNKKAFTNLRKEMFAIAIDDKETQDDNYVIKYFLKAAPIASQLDAFILLFYPDLAKELGMRAQSEARPVGR